jgi:Skp family chaperone for outer membrane proteins
MQPDQNQYEFIMDPSQVKGSGPAFLQDPKKRNIIAGLFVGTVLLLIVIIFAIVSSLSSSGTSAIVDVASYQTELARISTLGLTDAKEPSARAKAATMQAFVQSDLAQTTSYLASKGKKLGPAETALRLNSQVNKDLESAKLRNNFEQELLDALETTSQGYKSSLQAAINSASSEKEKEILQSAASNILVFEGS